MRKAKLKDLFDYLPKSKVQAGDGLEEGIYPFYTSSEKQTKYLNEYQHSPGCLVFGTGGKASVHLTTRHFSTSTDCIIIKSKSEVEIDVGYVFQYFKGNMQVLENGFKGAGLKHISKAYLSDIQIPYPEDIDEQRRIAHLLSKVEGLIDQRKQHLQQLDDLLKSVFLEMFGDPVRNEKGWPASNLDTFIDQRRGISYGIVQRGEHFPGGVPVLRIRDVIAEEYLEENLVRTDPSNSEKYARTILHGGELLLSIRGTVGAISVAPPHSIGWNVSRELAIIPVTHGINKTYLVHLLKSPPMQRFLSSMIKGVAQSGLNLSDIRRISVILPPDGLQRSYEQVATKIKSTIQTYKKSLGDLDVLYGALSQQAFKGELDLSRVPMPGIEPEEEKIVAAELLQIPAEKGLAI